ncbi:hypothetical protein, partial [Lysinibacillus sp. S2017]|uniref:hypothetical protein n=1 Tax=Lysinibacillus sp. S2017 TaxID=2561923 RepID=UPI00197C1ED6
TWCIHFPFACIHVLALTVVGASLFIRRIFYKEKDKFKWIRLLLKWLFGHSHLAGSSHASRTVMLHMSVRLAFVLRERPANIRCIHFPFTCIHVLALTVVGASLFIRRIFYKEKDKFKWIRLLLKWLFGHSHLAGSSHASRTVMLHMSVRLVFVLRERPANIRCIHFPFTCIHVLALTVVGASLFIRRIFYKEKDKFKWIRLLLKWLFGHNHLAGSLHASRTAKIMSQSVCCDIIFVTKAKRQSQFNKLYRRSLKTCQYFVYPFSLYLYSRAGAYSGRRQSSKFIESSL